MATKTISIDLDAYERLARSRRHPRESFSQVIRRAVWPSDGDCTGRDLLHLLDTSIPAPASVLLELEKNQFLDTPPDDPWQGSPSIPPS